MVDEKDPAYPYAKEATAKEAKNAARRAQKRDSSVGLNLFAGTVLAGVSVHQFTTGQIWYAALFAAVAVFNLWAAYKTWKAPKA